MRGHRRAPGSLAQSPPAGEFYKNISHAVHCGPARGAHAADMLLEIYGLLSCGQTAKKASPWHSRALLDGKESRDMGSIWNTLVVPR